MKPRHTVYSCAAQLLLIPGSLLLSPLANCDDDEATESVWYGEATVESDWRRNPALDVIDKQHLQFHEITVEGGTRGRISKQWQYHATAKAVIDYFRDDNQPGSSRKEFLELTRAWLQWQSPGHGTSIRFGRQTFEEPRHWWWDEELDAVRVSYGGNRKGGYVALAKQLAPRTTINSRIDPEEEDVLRLLGEYFHLLSEDHRLGLFMLHQTDNSTANNNDIFDDEPIDASDAELTWLGMRLTGKRTAGNDGMFNYWADTAWLWGDETITEFDEVEDKLNANVLDVSAWAIDAGFSWKLFGDNRPFLHLGYAVGSGDRDEDNNRDHNFRQTRLQGNEGRFKYYGEYFSPELSNLKIMTAGVVVPVGEDNTFIIGYHNYRQYRLSDLLPEAEIEFELSGERRDIGGEFDLIWQSEPFEDLSIDLVFSVFRAGKAAVDRSGVESSRIWLEIIYEF